MPPLKSRNVRSRIICGGLCLAALLSILTFLVYAFAMHITPTPQQPKQDYFLGLSLEAKGIYVLDIRLNRVLFERNADLALPLASITKVPLMLVIAPVVDTNEQVVISNEAAAQSVDLQEGEMWRAGDLIDFTLLASSNAGAIALAEAEDQKLHARYPHAPRGSAAVALMNSLAQDLGLLHTRFLNPSGLDVNKTQAGALGSARDIGELFAYAARSEPGLFASTQKAEMDFTPIRGPSRHVSNTNEALHDIDNLIIGKTGTTPLAGGNLAIVFEANPGRPVAVVVLGGSENGRFSDVKVLVEAAKKATKASK